MSKKFTGTITTPLVEIAVIALLQIMMLLSDAHDTLYGVAVIFTILLSVTIRKFRNH